jgi:hypothetical protein
LHFYSELMTFRVNSLMVLKEDNLWIYMSQLLHNCNQVCALDLIQTLEIAVMKR